jgi:hypothetical protein
MVIEYQINRLDLLKLLYYNVRRSQRTQLIFFGALGLVLVFSLVSSYFTYGSLSSVDILNAFMAVIIFLVGVPVLVFLLGKTQVRRLSIEPDGIKTQIGSATGNIEWKAIETIVDAGEYIYITGKNTNAFTIPAEAFPDEASRHQFMALATRYHGESNNPSHDS